MKRIPAGENPKPEFGASLLRFSSESTESNESGRSPGSSDFCLPSHPLFSAGAEEDNGLLDKSFFRSRYWEGTDLQLRGQLRYYTGFPINPWRLKASGNLFRLQT